MAVKFSQFNVETDVANVGYLVGYDGTDNVQITPANLIASSSIIDGSGTAQKIPKWVDAETLTDSIMTEDPTGPTISVAGNIDLTGTLTGTTATFVKDQNADSIIQLYNANAGAAAQATIYVGNSSAAADGLFLGANGTGMTTAGGFVQDGAAIGSGTGASGGLSIMTRATADMRFYTDGHTNERMRINSGGNVGIGITTTPVPKLAIGTGVAKTNTGAQESLYIGQSNEASNYAALQVYSVGGASAADRKWVFQTLESGVANAGNLVLQQDGGYVGIGTTPQFNRELLVKGEIAAFASDSGDNQLLMAATSTQTNISATYGSAGSYVPMEFETGGAVRMTIDSSGNVDIGGVGGSAVRFTARGSTTDTTAYSIEGCDSAGATKFLVRNDGAVYFGGLYCSATDASGTFQLTNANVNGGYAIYTRNASSTYINALQLDGDGYATLVTGNSGNIVTNDANGYPRITLNGASAQLGLFRSGSSIGGMYIGADSNGLQIRDDAFATKMQISNGGKVTIGGTPDTNYALYVIDANNRTQSTAQFHINGSGYSTFHWLDATAYYITQNSNIRSIRLYSGTTGGVELAAGGTSWGTFSDETEKENIKPLDSVLDKIKDYRCVKFNFKDDEEKETKIGFIAQDWENDFAETVYKSKNRNEEEKLAMKYTETMPVLLKAIQELKAEIDELKNK